MTTEISLSLGKAWLSAFNRRDLEALLDLYAEDCTHFSPKLRAQKPETGGKVEGKAALREWWAGAFQRLSDIRYQAFSITGSEERVVLEYWRHVPGELSMPVAEVFEVRDGKIVTSRVYHG